MAKKSPVTQSYLLAIVGLGCILRVFALLNRSTIEIDGMKYARVAEAFLAGHFREGLSNVFSPGYPLAIALFHLIIPDVELAGRLASVFFGTFLIWLCFLFGKKVLEDNGKALWLSFFVAVHPYLIRYSGQVMSESFATFLFTLAVFSFYVAWQDKKWVYTALCGSCLALVYLTRPEYLIYYAPLILMLLWRRRVIDSIVLILPLLILGSLYVLQLHSQTGLWIVSNKATTSPFVSLPTFFATIPRVLLCFCMAITPFLVPLAAAGFRRLNVSYRGLALILIGFHILSLAFIAHSTRRYSVEFIPLCLVSAVEGIYLVFNYLSRFFSRRLAYQGLMVVLIASLALLAYQPKRFDRALNKEAGLFLLSHDPGSTIAARRPIVAFYARGSHVSLNEMATAKSNERINRIVIKKRVKYLILDEEIEKKLKALGPYLSDKRVVWSAGNDDTFLRIYQVR